MLGRGADLASTIVVAPFLGPRTRALLEEAGASYLDDTGNLRLVMDRPAIFLRLEGAQKNPIREARALTSLKGPATARVVRALVDFRPPYGVRALAAKAGASPASVSRVAGLLEREALLERSGDDIARVEWTALIKRWVADYHFMEANEVHTFLEPRGINGLLGKLRRVEDRAIVTGSLAAVQAAALAPPRLAAVYVDDPVEVGSRLDLRSAEAGANVLLVRPFSPVVFERSWEKEGIRYAGLSQVAADLLTSPGRAPSEGEALLGWMSAHEGEWRG